MENWRKNCIWDSLLDSMTDQAEIVGCGNPSMDSDNLQAANVWDDEFNLSMSELGYKRLCSDYCAYICEETEMLSP